MGLGVGVRLLRPPVLKTLPSDPERGPPSRPVMCSGAAESRRSCLLAIVAEGSPGGRGLCHSCHSNPSPLPIAHLRSAAPRESAAAVFPFQPPEVKTQAAAIVAHPNKQVAAGSASDEAVGGINTTPQRSEM
ncbi:hypothetical protein SKAU_G00110900 [Synaphobranchus kaupii]|uniref:Uncharacterized protein n=1 Tax=Synaphobranchus kaupii TaxID=118154 RepID=A0A9Q1G131_SYNKA|nr:hypothetical protein SKAU_G00110900 [Synaphobranchus kaupii]